MREKMEPQIQEEIRKSMSYWRIPSVVLGIVREGREPEIYCYGCRDIKRARAADERTRFCMASVSKSFTAAAAMMLCDQNMLPLDVPVSEYAPELLFGEGRPVTMRDMLCHRTGLANHDAVWPGASTRAELAQRIRYLGYNLPFRSSYQYNNTVYVMAGYLLERAAGKSYSALLREMIFDPLEMEDCSSTEDGIRGSGDMALPYQVMDGERRELHFWNMDLAAPAAGVNATVRDMTKWVRFHMDGGRTPDGKQLISEQNFRQMHSIQIPMSGAASPELKDIPFAYTGYGFGWRTAEYRGMEVQLHTGKIEGYSSIQAYLPGKGFGAVIMMNLHSPAVAFFGGVLADLTDSEIFGEFRNREERLRGTGEFASLEEYRDVCADYVPEGFFKEVADIRQIEPSVLVGSYENPGYGGVCVTQKNGRLFLFYRDQNLPLQPAGGSRFVMNGVKEDIWTIRMPVEFEEHGGKAVSVKIRYEEKLPAIAFTRRLTDERYD